MSIELRDKIREERERVRELWRELAEIHAQEDRDRLQRMIDGHEAAIEKYQMEIADEWRKRANKAT